jgi:hypothetical protein
MVAESDELLKADPESLDILSYYANAISHWRDVATTDSKKRPGVMNP